MTDSVIIDSTNKSLIDAKLEIKKLKAKLSTIDGKLVEKSQNLKQYVASNENIKVCPSSFSKKYKAGGSTLFVQVHPLLVKTVPENTIDLRKLTSYSLDFIPQIKEYFYYEVSDGTHTFFSNKYQCNWDQNNQNK